MIPDILPPGGVELPVDPLPDKLVSLVPLQQFRHLDSLAPQQLIPLPALAQLLRTVRDRVAALPPRGGHVPRKVVVGTLLHPLRHPDGVLTQQCPPRPFNIGHRTIEHPPHIIHTEMP